MKKGIGKALEEFGKHLLNIAVAIIVFTIIQPYIHNEIDINKVLIVIFIYFFIVLIGLMFIWIGGNKDDS